MSVATRFFQLLCNKAHWNPEKLIVHYTTFSIKSWIPVGFVASLLMKG
ncbi:hypothetical protein [Wolbachia endosymbiont (group A) of Chalcis sispes]